MQFLVQTRWAHVIGLLLLLVCLAHESCSFPVRPLITKHQIMIKKDSRSGPLLVHRDNNDDEGLTRPKEPDRQPEKLYNHDDWVEFRSEERKMNEIQDMMLPLVAMVVLYTCFVAIVI